MPHHKRRRPKNRRSGCLMCKPNKANGGSSRSGPRSGIALRERQVELDQAEQLVEYKNGYECPVCREAVRQARRLRMWKRSSWDTMIESERRSHD